MAKNNNLTDFVTDLANAKRAKCKITGKINPQDFSKFVGGMPFYKYSETRDITAPSSGGVSVPLYYESVYIKGEVYLTNDNGLTEISADDGAAMISMNGTGEIVGTLNNTSGRLTLTGVWHLFNAGYISNFVGLNDGQDHISAGWHIKLDIYELCMGNPDGEYTKLDLNNAVGGVV